MTLDGFRDVTETPISLDFSNSWIADIRLNAGDKDGRTITVAITDNGQPITSTTGIKSVALAYNTAPGSEVGDRVPMTPVSGQATATYRATLPRRAIAKPGVIALGVEVTTADGAKICSRNFKGVVERAVWDAESTQGQDSLTRLEQLIADGGAAITRVNNAITDANNAVAAANQVIADARITGGNTTTLDPNQPATSSLRGSGLQRILDLGIPRGAGVTSAGATTLDPNKPATASMLQAGSKGDYTLLVGVPRGSRIIGVAANTVNPSQQAAASMSTDGAGDRSLILDIPRGERIAGVTARTLDAGMDATVTATRDAAGDTTLAFGLPRGAKGDPGDPGTPATATTLGVVKPGDNLTVRADGTLDASAGQYELPVASDTTLGGVKVSNSDYTNSRSFPVVTRNGEHLALSFKLGDNAMPDGIEFHGTENTTIGLKKATSTALGVVKPDGTTITADTDGTISAFTATASTLMGEGGATMGDALEVAPGIWLCIIRQWVITTQGGYYDAFSFSVYDRAGSRIALAASPTAGTYLILPVAGNARTKEYNYDTLMGKWVCTTTNTADTAQPDPCTLLLRARA
ncbi:phage tail protein [Bifidobacterium bifidum]|uniref:phage tail protein n=1 Tax=Bifidobacterium bifidum TaxID=1681 RepID=UPI00232E705C|nr:phage tail protein [Bifidobacterium bifidum]MDB1249721.1 phage tail protein [Bifidobacterium bifidum]MDB1250959.1 phage tail protein [Bifidobacterium bifidum]